jgi:PAS domain S-box-containing protein
MSPKPTYEELEERLKDLEEKARRLERVEADLKKHLRFTETLLLAIPTPVFFKDAQGRYQGINKALAELLGIAPEEIIGKTVQEMWPGELAEEYHRRDLEVMKNKEHQTYEFKVKDKDGRFRPVIFNKDVFYNEKGEVAGLVGSFLDISERKRAEEALRESEAFLNKVLSASLSGLYIYDFRAGRNVFINRQYTELSGYTLEDLSSMSRPEFVSKFHPEDQPGMAEHLKQVAEAPDGAVVEIEFRFLTADGRWIQCLSKDSVFSRAPDGTVEQMIGAFLDMSDLKATEKQLKELNENLEKLVAERTALAEKRAEQLKRLAMQLTQTEERERMRLSSVLHDDLQQMLAAVKLNLRGLSRRGRAVPEPEDPEFEEKLRFVSDILDESIRKTRHLSHELSPMTLSRNNLFAALARLAHDMMEKNLLAATVEAEPETEPESPVISTLLFRSAKELLFNVVKHAGTGAAKVFLAKADGEIMLVVEDKGKGFDIRAQKEMSKENPGFGLFSIEDRITLLGGRMKIETAPGKGCRVVLIAPKTCRVSDDRTFAWR